MDAAEVIIEAMAPTKPLTVVYTCPYCCEGKEGIQSEVPDQLVTDFLAALQTGTGCQTPCPNCGQMLLLQLDASGKEALRSGAFGREE